MDKIINIGDQDALLERASGQLWTLIESERHIKSASSDAITEKLIRDNLPDKKHFAVHYIAIGAAEDYGCVAADTFIARPDGSHTPIVELAVGDAVLSGQGRSKKIKHKFEYDLDFAYEIDVCGLPRNLVVSPNHPFMAASFEQFGCERDKYKRCLPPTKGQQNICKRVTAQHSCALEAPATPVTTYQDAETLRCGDFLTFRLPEDHPPRPIHPLEARFIGYWLAEGCFQKNAGNKQVVSWRFAFNINEVKLHEKLRESAVHLGLTCNIYNYEQDPNTAVIVVAGNPELAREHYQWFDNLARHKVLPLWMCNLATEAKIELLTAYYEGDGHTESQNRSTATTGSYDLACGIQRLLWSLGIPAVCCEYFTPERNPNELIQHRGRYWRVVYSQAGSPGTLDFTQRSLLQTTKVHGFVFDHTVYLPIRGIRKIEWGKKIYTLEVEEDHSYVSGGVHSKNSNKNGDEFRRKTLEKYHPTFVKYGYYFREHAHRDPSLAIGMIKASAYNQPMRRVELLIWGDKEKAAKEYAAAKAGKDLDGSMSCRVKFDVCTICGHQAKTAAAYCWHARDRMTQYLPQFGKFATVDNPDPTFFDFSSVANRADRIARHLEIKLHPEDMKKAASTAGFRFSEDLATEAGILLPESDDLGCHDPEHQAWLVKLAEAETYLNQMERQPGNVARDERWHFVKESASRAFNPEAVSEEQLLNLRQLDAEVLFRLMAKRASVLPFNVFCAYLQNQTLKAASADPAVVYAQAQHLPALFNDLLAAPADLKQENLFVPASAIKMASVNYLDHGVTAALDQLARDHSLVREHFVQRVLHQEQPWPSARVKSAAAVDGAQKTQAKKLASAYARYKVAACKAISDFWHQDFIDAPVILLLTSQHR